MSHTTIELPLDLHPARNLTFPIAELLVEPAESDAYDFQDMSKASETSEHTFETAISRLEHLVEEMESDRMPLEQLLVAYEEGTKLVKVCQLKLTEAEKKIEIIQRKASGEVTLKEFDPAGKAEGAASSSDAPAPARKAAARDISLF